MTQTLERVSRHARARNARRAIPKTMKAVAIDRFGGPAVLEIRTLPVPPVAANEVLIALDYAGVGRWDASIRKRGYAEEAAHFPLIPGIDGTGIVVAKGGAVRHLAVGDRVYSYSYANPKGGFHAAYVAVAAAKVARVPRGIEPVQAGALAAIALTALQGVDDALEIGNGDALAILGASGNVGMLAVQFAKWRHARVLGTASGGRGVAFVRGLGADRAVEGRRGDPVAAARRFAPEGLDAVLALVGGATTERVISLASRRGARAAYPGGVDPAPKKRRGAPRVTEYDAEPGVREFERLNRALVDSGARAPIAAVYDLEDVADAHRHVERKGLLGKVMLRI